MEIVIALIFSAILLLLGYVALGTYSHKISVDLVINTQSDAKTADILSTLNLKSCGSVLAVVHQADESTVAQLEKLYKIDKIIYL